MERRPQRRRLTCQNLGCEQDSERSYIDVGPSCQVRGVPSLGGLFEAVPLPKSKEVMRNVEQLPTVHTRIRLTSADYAAVQTAAELDGRSTALWMRRQILLGLIAAKASV